MSKECLVLGAGIVGVSVALRLAQSGVDVTLVDAAAPASGTTGTSGSMVGSNEKRPHEYFQLGLLSMAAMRRLAAELDHDDWFLPHGHLEWADTDSTRAALDERVELLQRWNYPVHRLTPDQVVRDLEPELLIPPDVEDVVFFSDDSIVYPHLLLSLMLRRLRALGVRMRLGAGHVRVVSGPDGVQGVKTADGEDIAADVVISCVGRWTEQVLSEVDVAVPMVAPWGTTPEALGFQVITTGVAVDVRRMIRMPGLSIRPAGGGRLMLHGRPEEVQLHGQGHEPGLVWDKPLVPIPPQAAALVDKARRVLANAAGAQVQSATASIRALTHDGLPVLGWVPGHHGLYAVVSHSAIGLGPLFGELVSAEVLGRPSHLLRSFRPDRFVGEQWRTRSSPMRGRLPVDAPMN